MREIRSSGWEGGGTEFNRFSLPLSGPQGMLGCGLRAALRYLARWFDNPVTKSRLLADRMLRHRLSTGNKNPRSGRAAPTQRGATCSARPYFLIDKKTTLA